MCLIFLCGHLVGLDFRRRLMHYFMEIFKKVDIIVTPTTGYVKHIWQSNYWVHVLTDWSTFQKAVLFLTINFKTIFLLSICSVCNFYKSFMYDEVVTETQNWCWLNQSFNSVSLEYKSVTSRFIGTTDHELSFVYRFLIQVSFISFSSTELSLLPKKLVFVFASCPSFICMSPSSFLSALWMTFFF